MILVCATCNTRYKVDDEAVERPSGRTVRCANCGHTWLHLPLPPAPSVRLRERPDIAAAPIAAVPLGAAPDGPTPISPVPRPAITAPASPRQRHRSGLGWVALILLIGAAAVTGILAREQIVALWPGAARLYELIGLKNEPLGAGLEIANVTSTRNPDGLVVEGDITNRQGVPRAVPHLRVALQDGSQHELVFKIVEPPRERLLPGETSHFVVGFLPAPDGASRVSVTFAAG